MVMTFYLKIFIVNLDEDFLFFRLLRKMNRFLFCCKLLRSHLKSTKISLPYLLLSIVCWHNDLLCYLLLSRSSSSILIDEGFSMIMTQQHQVFLYFCYCLFNLQQQKHVTNDSLHHRKILSSLVSLLEEVLCSFSALYHLTYLDFQLSFLFNLQIIMRFGYS